MSYTDDINDLKFLWSTIEGGHKKENKKEEERKFKEESCTAVDTSREHGMQTL